MFLKCRIDNSLSLSFDEIETVIGHPLPPSAGRYEAWWSNNDTGHSHARAWIAAGWRTSEVDLANRRVTFRRAAEREAVRRGRKVDPWGCMAGMVTIMPGTDLTKPTGEEWNDEKGFLLNE
jgi:hypothetical protein